MFFAYRGFLYKIRIFCYRIYMWEIIPKTQIVKFAQGKWGKCC